MMSPAGPDARTIADVAWYLIIVSAIVVAVVTAAVIAIWLRARRRTTAWSDPPGPDGDDAATARSVRWLGAYVPAAILVVTFGVAVGTVIATDDEGDAPVTIDVVGRQWFWDVTYPREGVRTANELHVPVGQRVLLRVTSADVIHSFWVPSLDRKIDLIPGRTNTLEIEATTAGRYEGRCAEFCGEQHAHMRFLVVAESPTDYAAWVAAQREPGAAPETEVEQLGQQVVLGSACAYCHTIAGTNATGQVGPDLTHVASRAYLAAGTIENNRGNLAGWLLDPQHIKPGNRMPASDLSGEEVQQVLAYIESLE